MSETVEITRYPNRRLYDRSQKKYVTLGDIESLVLGGQNVRVRDNKSEEDITRVILIQILLERHPERMKMFPVTFLQEVLRADQRALDWLTVYFGNAKGLMDGFAGEAGAGLFPGLSLWQSIMTGARPARNTTPAETPAPSPSHAPPPPAVDPDPEQDLAAKLAELEKRLAQIEGGTKT